MQGIQSTVLEIIFYTILGAHSTHFPLLFRFGSLLSCTHNLTSIMIPLTIQSLRKCFHTCSIIHRFMQIMDTDAKYQNILHYCPSLCLSLFPSLSLSLFLSLSVSVSLYLSLSLSLSVSLSIGFDWPHRTPWSCWAQRREGESYRTKTNINRCKQTDVNKLEHSLVLYLEI